MHRSASALRVNGCQSGNNSFKRVHQFVLLIVFRLPAAQQGVEQDGAEGCRADAAQCEVAELEGEVCRAQHQGDGHDDEVAAVGEVHLVVHPDARAGNRDQSENDNGHAAQHRRRNEVNERAEFGAEAEHNGNHRGGGENQRGVDLGRGHHADVLGIGGHPRAPGRARDDGGQAVAEKGAAHVAIEVAAGHGGDGLDVAQVLRHQNDHDGHDQRHRLGLKLGRGERRHAEPGGVGQAGEIHRRAQAQAIGEHGVNHAGDQQTHQNEQPLHHAAGVNRHQTDADEGDQRHPVVEVARAVTLDGDGRQIQPDHRDHRAGHHRRHEPLDPFHPHAHDDEADHRIHHAAGDDAAQRDTNVGVRPAARIAAGRDDHADERKRRAEITRHSPADDQKENQRADAAHQNRDIGTETHEQRREHRRAEHGHHMLQPHHQGLRPGQAFIRGDHPAGLELPFRKVAIGHIALRLGLRVGGIGLELRRMPTAAPVFTWCRKCGRPRRPDPARCSRGR